MSGNGKNNKGGRPKGKKNPETLEREAVLKEFRQRTMRVANKLFDSQMTLARGQTYLYKIEKHWEGTGKNRILKKKAPKLVTSQIEIEAYLDGLLNEGELTDNEATYYFITTKQPDVKAIDSLLDRSFGRPQQNLDVTSGGEKIVVLPGELTSKNESSSTT